MICTDTCVCKHCGGEFNVDDTESQFQRLEKDVERLKGEVERARAEEREACLSVLTAVRERLRDECDAEAVEGGCACDLCEACRILDEAIRARGKADEGD
jgi:hypothetical protein